MRKNYFLTALQVLIPLASNAKMRILTILGCWLLTSVAFVSKACVTDPGIISGPSAVCVTGTVTLADAIPGGVWSSSASGIASVDPAGVVTGVAGGTATISYTVTDTCGTASAIYT